MQLDIFEHSRDVMLRNDVLEALQQRDGALAHKTWQALADEFPNDTHLASLRVLVARLQAPPLPDFGDHAQAQQVLHLLDEHTAPAARQSLGDVAAAVWLRPLFSELARCARQLPFDATHSPTHAAALWLRATD
ncbi:MAG: hypothetical protein ABIR94_20505, partial [Rubrivivax sp.]